MPEISFTGEPIQIPDNVHDGVSKSGDIMQLGKLLSHILIAHKTKTNLYSDGRRFASY